ncbi:MmgE/PrpD family protein [Tropicimonas sp. IMCC34011]|uniref:MmgE/PrpD family protein n=1 Tax=Tropicimonas sp. IMCC34011 TaxID=2248759 RepID=UPI000E271EC3|nr:MmgE/PrpD family protein [Tropicimonas sp. IMCC34011]
MTAGLTYAFARILLDAYHGCPAAHPQLTALFVDGISVALAGAQEPSPTALRSVCPDGDAGGVHPIGGAGPMPLLLAVRAGGAAMHVLDYEPMWSPANHSVSTILPALLGLAELRSDLAVTGRDLLAAFAVGIEAQLRLRRASQEFDPKDLRFHPPGLVGPLGSAAACACLLGLDADRMRHAMGIAASRSGALLANVGSMTKSLHCGAAAADGLDAALLAEAGFQADPDALGNPRGFLAAFFGEAADPHELTREAPLALLDPGPAYKFYPSQYGTHFVIEAALAARRQMTAGAQVRAVRIVAPPMPYVDRPAPASGLDGKFSFQYVAAAAILDARVALDTFADARRRAPDMEPTLPKVVLAPDPAREGRFDRMVVDVEIDTDRGMAEGRCDGPPGIWGRAAPAARLADKARDCLAHGGVAPDLHARLDRIAEMGADELAALTATLRPD